MKKLILPVLILCAIVGAVIIFRSPDKPVVPEAIQKQANYAIFYPQPGDQTSIQQDTFKYDPSTKQASFVVNFMGRQITFAEQSSPESFADNPNIYPQFVQKLNNYATFDSLNGRVDLTRPKNVNGQAGIMNAKGTLMFASLTTGSLTENQWKELFNNLEITK